MRSLAVAVMGGWLALLVAGGCANVLGLNEYGPEPGEGGGDPGGDPLGTPCDSGDSCESGLCGDGRCCDARCDEACLACDLDGLEGSCQPRPAGGTNIACAGICDGGGSCLLAGGEAELIGGAGLQRAHSIDGNAEGQFVLGGFFDTNVTFQRGGVLPFAGGYDGFVAAFDASGGLVFERAFGGAGDERVYAVAIGPDGQVAATGHATTGFNFAGDARTYNLAGDAVVLGYSADGIERWAASPMQNATYFESGFALAIDEDGKVWAGGDIADVDGLGGYDAFLNVYDGEGVPFSTFRFGVDGAGSGIRAIAADRDAGRVLVAGHTEGSLNFAPVSGAGVAEADMFLIMFDSGGTPVWGQIYANAAGSTLPLDVAFDAEGGFSVTGLAWGDVNLGGTTLMADTATDANGPVWDIFVASYTADGDHRFSQVFSAPAHQIARAVAFDGAGRLLVAGEIQGAVELGPTAPFLPVNGGSDGFVGRFTPGGQHLTSDAFGDAGNQQLWDAAIAPDGTVRLVGWAAGTSFDVLGTTLMPDLSDVLLLTLPP